MFVLIHIMSMALFIVFNIFYAKHFNISKPRALLISIFSLITLYIIMIVITWVDNGFKGFGAQNIVRAFVFGVAIFWIESKIFKIDFRTNCDFQAVWPMIMHGVSHYACIIEGCCHGYHYTEGTTAYKVAHALTGTNMLPNQFFESTAALIVGLIVFLIARKHNYNMGGRSFFVMLIIFGTNRFLWEFLRDNEKVIVFSRMPGALGGDFGISRLACWAAAMVIEGIIAIIILNSIDKKKKQLNSESVKAA